MMMCLPARPEVWGNLGNLGESLSSEILASLSFELHGVTSLPQGDVNGRVWQSVVHVAIDSSFRPYTR
jgi:hypothetical protein